MVSALRALISSTNVVRLVSWSALSTNHPDPRPSLQADPCKTLPGLAIAPSDEDGDHRPTCDDLVYTNLQVRLLRNELEVDLHHRRFALRSLSELVRWVGRSARDAVGTPLAEWQVRSLVS